MIDKEGGDRKCQSIYFAALAISQGCFALITFHSHLLCQNCHREEQNLKDYWAIFATAKVTILLKLLVPWLLAVALSGAYKYCCKLWGGLVRQMTDIIVSLVAISLM